MEGAITACAWVKYSGFESHSNILAIGNGHNSDNILLHNHHNTVTSTNTLQWIILRGSVWKSVAVSNILELGKWMHICGAVESTGEMKVYVNGVEQKCTAGGTACDATTGKGTDGWTPNRLHRQQAYIGRSSWGAGEYFKGSISDVTIVDGKALTAAEIAEKMLESAPFTWTFPFNKFDNGTSNTAVTSIGANSGQLSATVHNGAVLGPGRLGGGGPNALVLDGIGISESDVQYASVDGGITIGGCNHGLRLGEIFRL